MGTRELDAVLERAASLAREFSASLVNRRVSAPALTLRLSRRPLEGLFKKEARIPVRLSKNSHQPPISGSLRRRVPVTSAL